ncbi:dihydrofolate synthase [Malassezia equina]|uniref:Dihydrofolate synthase n=1 Tax=Malassezia equina TaxID=1381935 RepID=A0AAF0EJ56_9BASI|nr:dihydrofolate synthase [Malassezia equina]
MAGAPPPMPVMILRSEPPLPAFCMPFPIPPPTSEISLLRLSVLRILTGQKDWSAPQLLTHSEQLKQMTVQGWRLRMLDLVQVQGGSASDRNDEVELGLPLLDEHKCSALEHGDEIVVKLHPGFTLADLQLPDLGPGYDYSVSPDEQAIYAAPAYTLTRPTEPSSHSSSVQANPTTNYQAFQYPDYRQGYKVVYTRGTGHGIASRAPDGLGPAVVTDTRDRGMESHQLAQLKGLARSNGAAGEAARAKLAEMGERIPDFRTSKAKKRLPKAPADPAPLPADSSLLTPNGAYAAPLMPPVPTAPVVPSQAPRMPPVPTAPPAMTQSSAAPAAATAPAVPAAATMPSGTTAPVATVGATVPASGPGRTRAERTSRLPNERVRLQRDTNTRSPFAGIMQASAPKLAKKKKKTTRSQLFGTAKATLQSRNPTATSQLFVPLYAAPFLSADSKERLTKPKRAGLLTGRRPATQAVYDEEQPSDAVPIEDVAGATVPMDHVPVGGLAAVGVPMDEEAYGDIRADMPSSVPPHADANRLWGPNERGLGVQPVPSMPAQAVSPYDPMHNASVPTSANAYSPLPPHEDVSTMPAMAGSLPAPAPIPLPEPVPSVMPTSAAAPRGANVQRSSSLQRLFHAPLPGQEEAAEAHEIRHDKRASLRAARDGPKVAPDMALPAAPHAPAQPETAPLSMMAPPPVPPKPMGPHAGIPHSYEPTQGASVDGGKEALLAPLSEASPLPPPLAEEERASAPYPSMTQLPSTAPLAQPLTYTERVPEHAPGQESHPSAHPGLEPLTQPISYADPVPDAVEAPVHGHHPPLPSLTQPISYAEPVPEAVEASVTPAPLPRPLSYAGPAAAPVHAPALPPPLSHEILSRIPVTSLDPEPLDEPVATVSVPSASMLAPTQASLPYLSSQRTLVSPASLSTTVLPARDSVPYTTTLSSLAPLAGTQPHRAAPGLDAKPAVALGRGLADDLDDVAHRMSSEPTTTVPRQDETMAHRDAVLGRARADDMERQWAEFEAQCRLNREAGLPPPSLLR